MCVIPLPSLLMEYLVLRILQTCFLLNSSVFSISIVAPRGLTFSPLFVLHCQTLCSLTHHFQKMMCIYEAINQLHSGKADANGIVAEHLRLCSSVIALLLSLFFTAIVRHGHMPQILHDSIPVPVLKNNKDASVSGNYCPIALLSTLNKVLERLLLLKYLLQ